MEPVRVWALRGYFQKVQSAFAAVKVPDDFRGPIRHVEVEPGEVKRKFARANPSYPADAIRVLCGGRYLSEVRICFTKDLKARACSAEVRDTCRGDRIIMRPVR